MEGWAGPPPFFVSKRVTVEFALATRLASFLDHILNKPLKNKINTIKHYTIPFAFHRETNIHNIAGVGAENY